MTATTARTATTEYGAPRQPTAIIFRYGGGGGEDLRTATTLRRYGYQGAPTSPGAFRSLLPRLFFTGIAPSGLSLASV
jgi:hypothetical protein